MRLLSTEDWLTYIQNIRFVLEFLIGLNLELISVLYLHFLQYYSHEKYAIISMKMLFNILIHVYKNP